MKKICYFLCLIICAFCLFGCSLFLGEKEPSTIDLSLLSEKINADSLNYEAYIGEEIEISFAINDDSSSHSNSKLSYQFVQNDNDTVFVKSSVSRSGQGKATFSSKILGLVKVVMIYDNKYKSQEIDLNFILRYEDKTPYKYNKLKDGTIEVYKWHQIEEYSVFEIPSEIDGFKVSKIADGGFSNCKKLTEIILPYGLVEIGGAAFDSCYNLNRAYIPSTVTTIGRMAFVRNAKDLYIFCGATSEPRGYYSVSSSTDKYQSWKPEALGVTFGIKRYGETSEYLYGEFIDETIHYSLYKGNAEVVTVPDKIEGKDVSAIGGFAFRNNINLKQVNLPKNLKKIYNRAFMGCVNLKNVIIPYGTETIDTKAFSGCSQLDRVYIPATVTSIDYGAFLNASKNLYVFCGVESAPSGYYKNIYNETWKDGVKKVIFSSYGWVDYGDAIFSINHSSTELTMVGYNLPESRTLELPSDGIIAKDGVRYVITSLGKAAKGDTQLVRINIPSSVTVIENNEFDGCSNLKFVFELNGSKIKSIGSYAFRGTKISELSIPKTIRSVGERAFANTPNLTSISFDGTITEWNEIVTKGSIIDGAYQIVFNKKWYSDSSIKTINCTNGQTDPV